MGYFSNGTEGQDYEERYCCRCVHYGPEDGPGCPVMSAHLLHNGCGGSAEEILDILIPTSDDGLKNEQCRMFIEAMP